MGRKILVISIRAHSLAVLMNLDLKAQPPHPYLLAAGLLLIFAGVRIHLIMLHGSQTPYWDDWSMGTRMAMYMESGFDASWLYHINNGHRAAFSKVTNLLLFKFNNYQWDPYLTMVFNTFLWGASGVFLIYTGFRERSKINPWLFCTLIIVLWTYPLSLFNILSTIQTYVYYMVLFVVCGFWLITNKIFSLKWWAGILCIGAACMTTGGGSFAPVAVTATSCFLALFNKQHRTQNVVTACFSGIFAAFGLYLILSQGGANVVGTRSFGDLLISLFKTLSWPSSDKAWPSIVLLLPIGLLALGVARHKIEQSRIATFALMMAAFGIMLSIAIAYARGVDGYGPAERYFDFLTVYFAASTLALMLIQGNSGRLQTVFNRCLTVLWLVVCLASVPYHLSVSRFTLNDRAALVPVQDDIMARYSVTSDPKIFENRGFRQVPYPSTKTLREMMQRFHQTNSLPYSLQASKMSLSNQDSVFSRDSIERPINGRYRGLESVLGSFKHQPQTQSAANEYVSEVLVAHRPYLMIPVSGHFGSEGTSIELIGENNGKKVTFRIRAIDNSAEHWFAYAAPRSVGRISYITDRIIKNGNKLWLLGILLIAVAFRRQVFQLMPYPKQR